MVLIVDADIHQALQLRLFDVLHLDSLVLDALANLAALLEVVEALLFLDLRVNLDLVTAQKEARSGRQ